MSDKPDRSEKTEKPTPKRKREARRKGQVPRSSDLVAWLVLLLSTWFAPSMLTNVGDGLRADFAAVKSVGADPQVDRMVEVLGEAVVRMLTALAPFLGLVVLVAIVSNLGQVGLVLTTYPLKPRFDRLNPMKGFKRIFSREGGWEVTKSFLKLGLLAAVAIPAVKGLVEGLVGRGQFELATAVPALGADILGLVRLCAVMGLGVAAGDYAYQRHKHARDLMMTKHEMRQEMKSSEGDQMLKAKIRSMQRGMSRNRMLSGVRDADVVITNPTHLAIALQYSPGSGAPKVVAMGADHVARRIRETASRHGVPIVEAKPIARALWATCKVDREIPLEMFAAVARVLAFVRRVAGRTPLAGAFVLPGV
jgi:flagellar biosynthetic protein FlhB